MVIEIHCLSWGDTYASSMTLGALLLLLLPFGAGLLTLRVVIVIEGGVGIGDGDGDFLDRSTGWASAMST